MSRSLPLAVFFLLLATPGSAHIGDVIVSPVEPLEGQTVFVDVTGWFGDSCWSYDHSEVSVSGSEIVVDLHAVDTWHSGASCPTVVVPYQDLVVVGPLDRGTYLLRVVENHDSLRSPEPDIVEQELVVKTPVGAQQVRWSRVKSLYRH